MEDFTSRFRPEVAEAVRRRANASAGFVPLLGISVEEFGPGTVTCRLAYRAELDNNVGMVHGGALSALVDHTVSLAVYPLVEPGAWVATSHMTLEYLAPVRTGDCLALGTVLSLRKRQAVVRVEVHNEGRLVAVALGGLSVRDKPSPEGGVREG